MEREHTVSTASRVGAAFGAGLLGWLLLAAPATAGPDDERGGGSNQAGTAEVMETPPGPGDGETDAHPGRRERQSEHGNSDTQGKSPSNPDGAGVDKPYDAAAQEAGSQEGTFGPTASNADDFDGNNGCGNDTDFADDNNGHCGGRPKGQQSPAPVRPATPVTPDNPTGNTPVVPRIESTSGNVPPGRVDGSAAGAQVLGVQIERSPEVLSATAPAPDARVLGTQVSRGAPAVLAATGSPLGLAAAVGVGLVGLGVAARRTARVRG